MRLRGDSGSEKMSVQDRIATERPGETGVAARCPRAPRTNLLLAATVRTDFGGAPVRIRNLSEGGAMVEGAALPAVGERLTLSRAQLAVGATVAWRTGDRCGVRFDRTVSVVQWAAGLKLPTGQAEVDAMQAAVRSGAAPTPSPAPDAVVREEVEQRIAEEIGLVARLIETMGDELADEPVVVHRHPGTLQNFDLAVQTLRHLGRILAAEDRAGAIATIGMDDLRARLSRQRNF
jgi:hypothetical protein